jgi:hypothetical protein
MRSVQQAAADKNRGGDQWNDRGQNHQPQHDTPPTQPQASNAKENTKNKHQGLWLAERKQNWLPPG